MNIYPSLMVVPHQELEKEIKLLAPYCAGFHIDIMDGIFVSDTVWYNSQQVNEMVKYAKRVWVHLMVQNPDVFYDQLELPADSLVSFHIESNIYFFNFLKTIKEKKHRVSLAINPKTAISEVIPFLNAVDQVLVMSVDPGLSGQRFLEATFDKIEELVAHRKKYAQHFSIGVDGGINKNNIHRLALGGVNDCAIAAGIFYEEDHVAALQELQKAFTI